MDAFILHAEGDESFAREMALRIAPSTSLDAPLAAASAFTFGEQLMVLALWSARAEAQGLSRQLADVAHALGDRCIVVRIDGTPLPALAGAAQVAIFNGRANDFAAMLKVARQRARPAPAPVEVRSNSFATGIAPGVGVGLAIYAGMFVAAGAWRSEDITQAMSTENEAPARLALRSFQTAFDAPETAHVRVASAEPSARFVQPQRVIVTTSLDTSAAYPVLPPAADAASAELAPVAPATTTAPEKIERPRLSVAPVRADDLSAATGALSLVAIDGLSALDVMPDGSL